MTRLDLKTSLALGIVAVGALASLGLVAVSPTTEQVVRPMPSQLIETLALEPRDAIIRIRSQGSIAPRIEAELVAEVSGRITAVAPGLSESRHFAAGDWLFEIDPEDYALLVERADAAHQRTASELQLANSNLERRSRLAERGAASAAD